MNKLTKLTVSPLNMESIKDSDTVITVIFPKSTAKNYPMAVAVAMLSDHYSVGALAGKEFHLASYSKGSEQLAAAANLCSLIQGISGAQAFIDGGRAISLYSLSESLLCYSKSQKANKVEAYCDAISSYPSGYLIPCRYLVSWISPLSEKLPHSLSDQLQALAVNKGCDWCPNFHPERIKKV
ncbi:hypothetical protein [Serratia marcescens]|uniref:hypothetical protein n=1 Tax=Serratia marcescens TaxID=615 RepID=UPI002029E890|nr:hypothetical protein [Serratia marcescens]